MPGAVAVVKVVEQDTTVCYRIDVFFFGSWRNFALVYSAMICQR
jgi:hypothetical protein